MPTNKKIKKEKKKKEVEYKTIEERKEQVKNILIEFGLQDDLNILYGHS